MLDLVGRVLGVLQTPGLGVVNGTDRGLVGIMVWGWGRMVGSCMSNNGSSMDDWMSHSVVDRSSHMVLHDGLVMGSAMVGNTMGGMVDCGDVGSMVSHWGSNCMVGNSHRGNPVCRGGSLVVDEGGDSGFVDWSLLIGKY